MMSASVPEDRPKSGLNVRRILAVMLLAVGVYAGFAIWGGLGKIKVGLAHFQWWTFGAAFGLAFGNYVLRFFKWQFYLAKLEIRNVGVIDSFLRRIELTAIAKAVGRDIEYAHHQGPFAVRQRTTREFPLVVWH